FLMGIAEPLPPFSCQAVFLERSSEFLRRRDRADFSVQRDAYLNDVPSLHASLFAAFPANRQVVFASVHGDGGAVAITVDGNFHRRPGFAELFFHVKRNFKKEIVSFSSEPGMKSLGRHRSTP